MFFSGETFPPSPGTALVLSLLKKGLEGEGEGWWQVVGLSSMLT